jgi:hypothetical protein
MTLVNLVKFTADTTGTGAITVGQAVPGYRGREVLTDGGVYSYSIQQDADWEFGRATYLAASNAFVRTPFGSSNGGVAIDLQPNAPVALIALAEDLMALAGGDVDPTALANEVARATAAEQYLSNRIVAASLGILSYTTRAALYANTTAATGTLAQVTADPTPAYNNFYRFNGATWDIDTAFGQAFAATVQPQIDALSARFSTDVLLLAGGRMVAGAIIDSNGGRIVDLGAPLSPNEPARMVELTTLVGQVAAALQGNLDAQIARLDAIPKLISSNDYAPIYSIERPNAVFATFFGATVDAFYIPVHTPTDELTTSALTIWPGSLAGKTTLRVSQIRRPLADGDVVNGSGNALAPGFGPNDVTNSTVVPYFIVVVVPNYLTNQAQAVTLDLAPFGLHRADTIYFYMVEVLAADGSVAIAAMGKGNQVPAATPGWARGWYRQSGGTGYNRLSEPGTVGDAYAFTFSRKAIRPATVKVRSFQQAGDTPNAFGNVKVLPDVTVRDASNPQGAVVQGGEVTFPVPANVTVTAESITLQPGGYASLYYAPLGGSVVVTPAGGGAALVEGTNYTIDYAANAIRGIGATRSVTVAYTGQPVRYDMVTYGTNSKVRSLTTGPVRGFDACEHAPRLRGTPVHPDYGPSLTAPVVSTPQRPLFMVRTSAVSSDVIPLHDAQTGVRERDQAEYTTLMARNARLLAPVIARARQGLPIIMTGYGDSLTAQGDSQSITVANGDRDTLASFYQPLEAGTLGRLAADTLARITRYPGDMGATAHQHLGWNWQIKRALELLGGSTVTYLNRGIGGSNLDTTGTGANNPARLAPVYADGAHLFPFCVGENDKGQSYIYDRVMSLIEAVRAGAPNMVLYLVPPPFNALYSPNITIEMSGSTYKMACDAATDAGIAYVPHALIQGPDAQGPSRLSRQDYSLCNGINHPGPTQLLAIGELAATPFLL